MGLTDLGCFLRVLGLGCPVQYPRRDPAVLPAAGRQVRVRVRLLMAWLNTSQVFRACECCFLNVASDSAQ